MRVCLPTLDEGGAAARLSPHFGRAPWFTVVDDGTGEVTAVRNEAVSHEHGGCAPVGLFTGRGVGAVICHGLGRGAHARLQAAGVRVYVTASADVGEALAEWRAGQLQEVAAEQLCHGHGGGHGH
jgi:predicted Fe-Mo cluster-binding NifX family protein